MASIISRLDRLANHPDLDQPAIEAFCSTLTDEQKEMFLKALGVVVDWRGEAIEYIRRGELSFEALASEFDHELASELFQAAGIATPIMTDRFFVK